MNAKAKKFLSVLLSMFVFVGVITTPVLATEAEPEEEVLVEETEVAAEEETQEETAEPTEEIAEAEEPAIEAEPETVITETEAVTEAEVETVLDGDVIITPERIENLAILEPGAELMAEGDEEDDGESDVTIGADKTVTDSDGDGIYELSLSVKATADVSEDTEAQRSNVVIVIDVSGSMDFPDTREQYTYNQSTYNSSTHYWGLKTNGSYQRVYRRNGAWRLTDNSYGTQYNGNVYVATSTRLESTKVAVKEVVDKLLAYNTNDHGITDMIEITVVKFAERTAHDGYNGTQTIIQDSTDAAAIKAAIDALQPGGGTHWRAALEQAKTEADYFQNSDPSRQEGEKTSVIFLTDGVPTERGTGQDGGAENDDNISRGFLDARAAARSIVSGGYDLYSIFAYGNNIRWGNTSGNYNTGQHTGFEFLRGLVNYAYGTGDTVNYGESTISGSHCFNATSTQALIDAFNSIIHDITNSVGYAGVSLTDGVSLGATSTSVAVNGTAKEESMRYTVNTPEGKTYYTVKINSSGAATFEIYDETGMNVVATLTDDQPETVQTVIENEDGTTTIESKLYSVTYGTGDDAVVYEMAPATIDADTGLVKWNLAGLGILKSGYEYIVSFDVWPNQLGYDIAADLNNKIYNSVDEALDAYGVTDPDERKHVKDALVHNDDGSYSIYTNYEQSIDYYPATSETDDEGNTEWTYGKKQSQDLPHPNPIPLAGSLIPLDKIWESSLSQNELDELLWEGGVVGGTPTKYSITLYIWKADTEAELDQMVDTGVTDTNKPYVTAVLGWDEEAKDYVWKKNVAVAPGMMVNIEEAEQLGFDITDTSRIREFDGAKYYVIEEGHYYYVTEDGSDLHFELETDLYHPMVVDGDLYNVYFGENGAVTAMDPMHSVVATNTLKGGLNIHKIVSTTQVTVENDEIVGVTEPVDEDGIETVTDEFTFEIKMWKVDDDGVKSAVYTYDDQIDKEKMETISGSIGYRVFSEPTLGDDGEIKYGETLRGAILTEDSEYAALANGIFATIADNETTIVLTMPANGEIRLVNLPAGTEYSVREIEDPTKSYTYAATESSVLTAADAEEVIADKVETTNLVSGKIRGNTASVETYYNWASNFYVYHSSDATIEKISFADSRVEGTYDAASGKYTYKFNIVDEVKGENPTVSDFLYGGYYKSYGGTKATDADIIALTYDKKDDGTFWADNSASDEEYTYAYIKSSAMKAWTYAEGYDVNGMEMNPEVDHVYYLKEVPNGYIRPYLHYTYGTATKIAQAMWLISDIDDANYQETGFFIDDGKEVAKAVASLTVKTANGGTSVKLTPEQVFRTKGVKKGYLTYIAATKYLVKNAKYTTTEYWITKDGLTVEGVTTRTINIGTQKITGDNKLLATDVDGLSVVTKK